MNRFPVRFALILSSDRILQPHCFAAPVAHLSDKSIQVRQNPLFFFCSFHHGCSCNIRTFSSHLCFCRCIQQVFQPQGLTTVVAHFAIFPFDGAQSVASFILYLFLLAPLFDSSHFLCSPSKDADLPFLLHRTSLPSWPFCPTCPSVASSGMRCSSDNHCGNYNGFNSFFSISEKNKKEKTPFSLRWSSHHELHRGRSQTSVYASCAHQSLGKWPCHQHVIGVPPVGGVSVALHEDLEKQVSWIPLAPLPMKFGWSNTSAQWKRSAPTVVVFSSGSK